jgi:hypothetical protein
MNDTQEYILQKSIDNLIKMVDKLNKDLEKVSKEADQYREEADYYRTMYESNYYRTMYEKYKQMYDDLLFHDIETKDPKPRDPTGLQNLLIYEAGVEDGKVSAGQEDKSQSSNVASSDMEEESKVKVKVNKTDEFCKLMDDIYPQK